MTGSLIQRLIIGSHFQRLIYGRWRTTITSRIGPTGFCSIYMWSGRFRKRDAAAAGSRCCSSISIAQETDLIVEIGDYLARTACQQCVAWWEAGLPKFTLAINLSVKQLQRGYADKLKAIVAETRFPLDQLEVEITESLVIRKGSEVMNELTKLEGYLLSPPLAEDELKAVLRKQRSTVH